MTAKANKKVKRDAERLVAKEAGAGPLRPLGLAFWLAATNVSLVWLLLLLVYLWPLGPIEPHPRRIEARPRPRFERAWALNAELDRAERLFAGQLHAPESMAPAPDGSGTFYTGLEGGFIVQVEPLAERFELVARLNARHSVLDLARAQQFEGEQWAPPISSSSVEWEAGPATNELNGPTNGTTTTRTRTTTTTTPTRAPHKWVPFCELDVQLYGAQAEWEPARVEVSRCSRPLGLRVAPSGRYLYASDPLSGLYRVELAGERRGQVSRLADLRRYQAPEARTEGERDPRVVMFADDIDVLWAPESDDNGEGEGEDRIFMTDCSQRWKLRRLMWLILENDATGRLLEFGARQRQFKPLQVGPVRMGALYSDPPEPALVGDSLPAGQQLDARNLSFPNGVQLTANKSALLISDLNNRRVLMHHIAGPLAGQTRHLLWVPGYADNIRRAARAAHEPPTYWLACNCAVSDSQLAELSELTNGLNRLRSFGLKVFHALGWLLGRLGFAELEHTLGQAWFVYMGWCAHGLVFEMDESGRVLRSLHAPSWSSHFKMLSEAHEMRLADGHNYLLLGSVYNAHLGRLRLN